MTTPKLKRNLDLEGKGPRACFPLETLCEPATRGCGLNTLETSPSPPGQAPGVFVDPAPSEHGSHSKLCRRQCPFSQPSSEGPTPQHPGVRVPSQWVWALTHGVIGVLPGHGWDTPIPSHRVWAEGVEYQALFPFQDLVSKRFVTVFCRTERTFSRRAGRYCSPGAMSGGPARV